MRLLLSVKDLEQCQPHNKCSKMLATVSIVVILHLHDYLIKVCLCPVSTMNIGQGLLFFYYYFPCVSLEHWHIVNTQNTLLE